MNSFQSARSCRHDLRLVLFRPSCQIAIAMQETLQNRYGAGPFCKFTIPRTYKAPGVYLLTTGDRLIRRGVRKTFLSL